MNRSKLFVLASNLIALLCLGTNATAGRLVDVEAAAIEYETTTVANLGSFKSTSSGKDSLYLKAWGNVQLSKVENSVSDMMGKRVEREMTLLDQGMVYSVDFDSKVIHKTSLEELRVISPEEFSSYSDDWRESLRKMGAKQAGSETILGYSCEIWEMPQLGSKAWIHKGLTLKTITRMAGVEATSVAVDVQIGEPSASSFELPGYPVVEGGAGYMSSDGETDMEGGYSDTPTPEELQQAAEMMRKMLESGAPKQ